MRVIDGVFVVIFAFILLSIGLYIPIPEMFRFVFYFIGFLFLSFFILLSLVED